MRDHREDHLCAAPFTTSAANMRQLSAERHPQRESGRKRAVFFHERTGDSVLRRGAGARGSSRSDWKRSTAPPPAPSHQQPGPNAPRSHRRHRSRSEATRGAKRGFTVSMMASAFSRPPNQFKQRPRSPRNKKEKLIAASTDRPGCPVDKSRRSRGRSRPAGPPVRNAVAASPRLTKGRWMAARSSR